MLFFNLYCTEKCIFVENLTKSNPTISAGYANQIMCQPAWKSGIFNELDKMFIKNDMITLRCAEPEDAGQIFLWENDRDNWRVSGTYVPYTRYL